MADIWFISDTHLCHANMIKFKREDGTPARPFATIWEHDETIIQRWNEVVKPQDHVWHLGDVIMGSRSYFDRVLSRLNGKKRLTLGNHDDTRKGVLGRHFEKIVLWRMFKEHNFVCCHIPLRKEQFRKVGYNVHGHIHHGLLEDNAYINVCVEHIDYRPVHMDEILAEIKRRGG